MAQEEFQTALRAKSVSLLSTIGTSVGIQGPTVGSNVVVPIMAATMGAAGPLAFLAGIVVGLFVVYSFSLFARYFASAGSVEIFNGIALGGRYGFISSWVLLMCYLAYLPGTLGASAYLIENLLTPLGVHIPWVVYALIVLVIIAYLAFHSVELSTRVTVSVEAVGIALMLLIAGFVIAHGGWHGHGIAFGHYLNPAGIPFGTLAYGVVFAFLGFAGFEASATLGEESDNPKRNIPIAMYSALVVTGLLYAFMQIVSSSAFPSIHALANASGPLGYMGSTYVTPAVGTIANIVALLSQLGVVLACMIGTIRLMFSLGRDTGYTWFAYTNPVHRTPSRAVLVASVIAGLTVLAVSGIPPIDAYGYITTYGVLLNIVAYFLTVLAAAIFFTRLKPVWQHWLIPGLGVVIVLYVIYSNVYPVPAYPYNILPYLAAIWLAAGVVLILAKRSLGERMAESPIFRVNRRAIEQ
jgi:amino acid transporter